MSFCFSLLSLNCSAAGSITHDELIEYGYVYDGVSYALPPGCSDPFASFPMTLLSPEKNVSGFDPKKIPWSDAPSFIHDIIYMSLDGAQSSDPSTYKMPFVLVRVSGSTAVVFVGYNVGLGYDLKNDRMRLCVTEYFYNNSVCYRASFNVSDYSEIDGWRKLSAGGWGLLEVSKVMSYTQTLAYPSSAYDFYFYGGNGVRVGNSTSVTFPLHDSSDGQCYFTSDNQFGFQSGRFFYNDSSSSTVYCETFIPPTVEQQEKETQKGIWETIKSIPGLIADQIKGLFIPREGYFTDYFNDLRNHFEPRLGLLLEVPEAAIDILTQLYEFEPSESGYSIHFPEVKMPVLDNGEWSEVVLISEQDILFDFLNEGAFATMYSMYRAVVWLIFVVLLINLIIRKANKIIGGSSS